MTTYNGNLIVKTSHLGANPLGFDGNATMMVGHTTTNLGLHDEKLDKGRVVRGSLGF